MIVMNYEGRKLSVKPTTRKGVSLDLFVNGRFVASARKGNSFEAEIAALTKLKTLVDRADNNRKPGLYESFWFERPFDSVNVAA